MSNANLKKSNGKFAWWRESRKPTWGGVPLPPPAGQGGRVGGGLPPPNRPPSTYIRMGRAPLPLTPTTLSPSHWRHHLLVPPPRAPPSRRVGGFPNPSRRPHPPLGAL